jgi:hypothetical protein
VTDWTTVATTLGAAGIAGLGGLAGGWYGARKTAEVSIKQVEADNERLREQHREDHLRNRQGTYHNLLNALAAFRSLLYQGSTTRSDTGRS